MERRPGTESSPNLPVITGALGTSGSSGPVSLGSLDRIDDFLERVLRVCQLREEARRRRVNVARKPSPAPFFEHAEVAFVEESGEARTYALAATAGGVTDEVLERFLDIHLFYRRTDPWTVSTLVYGGDPAPESLVRRGRNAGVHVRSFIDFQGLIDFRPYLEKQNRRLENDPIYPPRLYVEQRMKVMVGASDQGEAEDAISAIEDWLASPYGRFVLVLGDFGTGKTFLMHELARRLGSARAGLSLCPLLVEMRALEKSQSLDGLIAQHLAVQGMERIDLKAFRYMLAEGRIALLFDGFDELALRVTYDRAVDHFDTLLEAASANAKVVVTSRTQHFYSAEQVRSALAEKASSMPGYRVAELSRFSEKQIKRFLVKKLDGDSSLAEARFRLLDEVKDLLGLSANPRMLSFIAEIPDEDLRRAKVREGEITAASLYRLLLERWLNLEYERAHPRGGAPGLTTAQRWSSVEALAKRLWAKTERTVNVSELPEEVGKAVVDLATRQLDVKTAAHQVGSGTLLVRDDRGNFSFIHQSVLEWLVAHAAAQEVAKTGASPSLLAREMSGLMAEFFLALAGRDAAARWAQGVLRGDGHEGHESHEGGGTPSDETAKRNAQLVLQRLGMEAGRGANLAGQNLRGRDLVGQNLRGADLQGADLSEARLVRAVLSEANLRGARLCYADLTGAPLDGADLSNADLSFARLLGADLRGAKLSGARFRAAKLVGAQLDPRALEGVEHFGAALPSPSRVDAQAAASSPCRSVAYSPDGDLIASAHDDASVRLWDVSTGRPVRVIHEHDGKVNAVAWSPSGRKLASASDDGSVRVWDVATGRELSHIRRRDRVRAVAWSPDGTLLAWAADDRLARISSWATGKDLRILRGHANWVRSIAWSPDGKRLATGSDDGRVRLWDAATGAESGMLAGHDGGVLSVAWTPGGTLIASGSEDATVRVWDVPSGKELRALSGHRGGVRAVAWGPEGKALASAGEDKSVRIWDLALGMETTVLEGHAATVRSVAWSPDGKMIASGSQDRMVRVWDLSAEKKWRFLEGHAPHANFVAFSPDGKQLVQGASDNTLRLWDVPAGRESGKLAAHEETVFAVAWSPDGKRLASGGVDGTLAFWNGGKAKLKRGHDRSIRSLAFSPDGKQLASGSKDRTVRLWDAETGEEQRLLSQPRGTVISLSYSPDGRRLAVGATDNLVRQFDPQSGVELSVFEEHGRAVQAVAFSPDGHLIASSSDDTTVRLWEAASRQTVRIIEGLPEQVTLSLAWDRAGRRLAGGGTDGKLRLWDATTGAELQVMRGHGSPIWSLAFSPDGTLLASGSNDGTVRLWDPGAGVCLAVLLSLPEGWVAFGPDGRYKLGGDTAGAFWHAVGLCRFEPGELDAHMPWPLHVADDQPLIRPR